MAVQHNSDATGSSSRIAPHNLFGTPLRVFITLALMAGLLIAALNATAQEDNQSTPDVAATPQATPSADMPRIELKINELNDSDLGGKVTLYEFGDKTIVEFAVTNAGGNHPAFISGGTCESPDDPVLFTLNPVDQRGKSTTVVDASLQDLLDDEQLVSIRMQADDVDTVIGCAVIEGEPSTTAPATPEASAPASATATPAASDDATPEPTGVGGSGEGDGTGGTSADANTLTINLVDWSDTGVTGTAVLTGSGDMTSVTVTLSGPGVVGDHQVHIHNGTCASPGSATYTLNPINANGTSTTTVNLSLDTLRNNSYFINVHPNEANWDAWMVCGNITGSTTAVTAVSPTATAPAQTSGDGTGGGNVTMTTTQAKAGEFPQTVGVGDGLRWPSDTRTAVIWGISGSIIILGAAGIMIRTGERNGRSPRFTRLGL